MVKSRPASIYIGIGANIEPQANLLRGLAALSKAVRIVGLSTVYRSPAIGRPEQPDYLNGVVAVETDLAPGPLRDCLRGIEREIGRRRTGDRFAARPLDLDILLHGNAIIVSDRLHLPDPEIIHRPFLAAGLLELNPTLRLPGAQEDLAQQIDPGAIASITREMEFTRQLKESLFNEP